MPFTVQIAGRLPSRALARLLDAVPGVRVRTIVRGQVRDRAAFDGLLRQLRALSLDLVELRRSDTPTITGLRVEVVVEGSIGDMSLATISDHADVTAVATRFLVPDGSAVNGVLAAALDVPTEIEFVVAGGPTPASVQPGPAQGSRAATLWRTV